MSGLAKLIRSERGLSVIELVIASTLFLSLLFVSGVLFTENVKIKTRTEEKRELNSLAKLIFHGTDCAKSYSKAGINMDTLDAHCTSTADVNGQVVGEALPLYTCVRDPATQKCDTTSVSTWGTPDADGKIEIGNYFLRATCARSEGGMLVRVAQKKIGSQPNFYDEKSLLFGGVSNAPLCPVLNRTIASTGSVRLITSFAMGQNHICAIIDGGVFCRGSNSNGQLGTGNTNNSGAGTVTPTGLESGVTQIYANASQTCAIVGGVLKCFGRNNQGQLGTGDTSDKLVPTSVLDGGVPIQNVVDLSLGAVTTCAVVETGKVKCWGSNKQPASGVYPDSFGTLGNNTAVNLSTSPVVVLKADGTPLTGATQVAVGLYNACALVAGQVYCWGTNDLGQVGNGSNASSKVATPVAAMAAGVSQIMATGSSSCAIQAGRVLCWGATKLRNSNPDPYTMPPKPAYDKDENGLYIDFVGAEEITGYAEGCVRRAGKVWCWGNPSFYHIPPGRSELTPVTTNGYSALDGASSLKANWNAGCALVDGRLYCWGQSADGQLGVISPTGIYETAVEIPF